MQEISIQVGDVELKALISIPNGASKIVLFVHGSGSGRYSPRNQYVAKTLNDAGIATLLMDLLTKEEEIEDTSSAEYRFNISLLSLRVAAVTEWISQHEKTRTFSIGYFGASTGAAAAIVASEYSKLVRAIVSRGGRPDLAGSSLYTVTVPTLLLVGGDDSAVIQLNQQAFGMLQCEKKLTIIEGATHLFEEPGTLEEVAKAAISWFMKYL